MAPLHFKSAATAVTAISALSKKSKQSSSSKKSILNLDACTNPFHPEPPQHHATTGDLAALKESIKAFGLTLKETDKHGSTLLHHATRAGQVPVMKYLLENGVELDAVDKDGNTALHLGACGGHMEALGLLLNSGASVATVNNIKDAPIHTAAREKSGKALGAFISRPGMDFSLKAFRNRTIAHIIAESDNIECCKVLHEELSKKGPVDPKVAHTSGSICLCSKDDDGLTVVHLAARKNSYKVLEFFIQHCKSHTIDNLLGFVDEEDSTPLHAAVDAGNFEVACVLLKYGACPTVLKGDIPPPLHLACAQGRMGMVREITKLHGVQILRSVDQNGRSPLHYSALSIHSHCIISLIAHEGGEGIDINQQDSRGRTPLHMSISSGNLSGMKEFLARGGDPFVKDNEGHNALHFAVLHNRKAIIEALLEVPSSDELTNEINAKGYSSVHVGLKLGLKDIVSLLTSSIQLQSKNTKDPHGNNYVHLAASSGDWKALTAFLALTNAHKLLNETNNRGSTPLHYASKNGHLQCIELLLGSGAMVHKSQKGVSPLMLACREGHVECVKLLYKAHPFQIDWQDDDGETALHYAAQSSSPVMVQQILDLGADVLHNDSGKSFLDIIIISNGNEDCAFAVVNHARWQECLDVVSPVLEHPMLSLVRKMPNVAKAVLDRCHTLEHSRGINRKETFNFKYLLTFYNELQEQSHGQGKSSGTSKHVPVLARARSKQRMLHEVAIRDLEMVRSMTMDRRRSTIQKSATTAGRKRKLSQTMEVLKRMIQHKRVELLIHPVVSAYMKRKWKLYGRYTYLWYYGTLSLLVFCLTVFVLLKPSPERRNLQTTPLNRSYPTSNNISETEYLTSGNYSENVTSSTPARFDSAQQAFRWLTVIANTMFTIDTVAGVFVQGWRFANFVDRILTWNSFIAIVLNYIFLLSSNPFSVNTLPVGAGACFFTWMVMFGALEFFDIFGVYVNMFYKILRTVFQVLFVCLFLLMAFALALYVAAGEVTEFSSPGFALFSVFGYTLGEIQYSLFIEKASNKSLPNSEVIIILIVLLAIMMSIVMANLLIGLAVGDIEQIKLNAIVHRKSLEIAYFTHLDHYAPKCLAAMIAPNSWTIHHHQTKHSVRKFFDHIMRTVRTEVLDMEEEDPESPQSSSKSSAPPVDVALEMARVKQQLQDISDLLHTVLERDSRRRQQCFRWKKPQSTQSIDSSNSDITMTASDFLADMA